MPTYDYVCQACGHALEIFQSMSENPKRKCPKCSKLKLQRQIGTGAGILFKGSGFYETDYRSDSYSKGAKEASEAKEKAKESPKKEKKDKPSKKKDD
jgi:putative FmdB family regulatory protein